MLHRNRADRPARAGPTTSIVEIASQFHHGRLGAAAISSLTGRTNQDGAMTARRATI